MILSFTSRFVPMVLDGSKRHTIRAGDRWKAGMRADLYTGGYQPGARKLLFRAPVTRVETISMQFIAGAWNVTRDGHVLGEAEKDALFYADGFRPETSAPIPMAYLIPGQAASEARRTRKRIEHLEKELAWCKAELPVAEAEMKRRGLVRYEPEGEE